MKALSNLAFERKQDGLTKRTHLRKAGDLYTFFHSSLTMSPETSHLTAMRLSFSKQKIEKLLLTFASPACGGLRGVREVTCGILNFAVILDNPKGQLWS